MSERMSEATKTVLLIIPLVAMSVFCGYRVGDKRGRAEQKKLDEAECAAHPVVKEVAPQIDREGLDWAYKAGAEWGVKTTLEECRKRFVAPQPSKGKRKPKDSGYIQWDDNCTKSEFGFTCPIAQPEVKPAPRLKDEGAKPIIQPEPWDCGDGKPTTDPCPAAKP